MIMYARMLSVLMFFALSYQAIAQSATADPVVPDWALPGSPTHKQVPPPADFHRTTRTEDVPVGIFTGQSDVGAALVPGSSSFNKITQQYTIVSAGYNLWYQRDEFRFCWKKMNGDVSLAADIRFPDPGGYGDRKAFVIIRQSLEDDSKEAVVALHGAGLLHLAWRAEKGVMMQEVRVNNRKGLPDLVSGQVSRIGIEKHGHVFTLFVSTDGGHMHQVGDPANVAIDGSFYAGIGFCSHLPAKTDTAVFSKLVLLNKAGALQ